MALTVERDLGTVVDGLTAWLAARNRRPVAVGEVTRPTDGWSSETVLLRHGEGGTAVRLPPLGEGIFPSDDLGLQARAMAAAGAVGVPVPVPAEVVVEQRWVGAPFLAMPLVDGHVPGEVAALDPWVRSLSPVVRRGLHDAVLDALVTLHAADPDGLDLPWRDLAAELDWWQDYLAWSGAGEVVAVTEALAWCRARRPSTEPAPALLWGDVRLGNVVFADDGSVLALLDWEMATIGAPEQDLGWWFALEALQDDLLGGRGPDLAPLPDLRGRYEAAIGRDLVDLEWHEAFALTRSAAVLTRIALLQQDAGVRPRMDLHQNPVLDHLRARTTG